MLILLACILFYNKSAIVQFLVIIAIPTFIIISMKSCIEIEKEERGDREKMEKALENIRNTRSKYRHNTRQL